MIYQKYVKRMVDIILSLFALIFLLPVLIVIALLIRFKIGSPVLFVQTRPGLNEKLFKMYKFRTMTNEQDATGQLLPDELRLTRFGKLLRATSLDELPELFNILIGDMSFVGPRPLLVQYLDLYNLRQKKRHKVRPGLTGYAQVSGRNSLSWTERFERDIEYVENISWLLDLKIIFMTVYKVFKQEGITSEDSATMKPFEGNFDE
ncbi:sugar transferase [Facklamia lactis]|uniref:sugar transferase n=1 Tax=Facklamia lactis TaxID=2749967 RepID=UPI001C552359|nr:sugar transferase [Facklamia lactis]